MILATYTPPVDPLASFDKGYDLPPPLPLADRSTLECGANCPANMVLKRLGMTLPAGQMADIGNLVHGAISATIAEYISDPMRPGDIKRELERQLLNSRPDLQPEVIDAAQGAAWKVVDLIKGLNPQNILRYDGGPWHEDPKKNRSGQLACDAFGARLTSEVDFLFADADSREVINEADWKTGRKFWTAEAVRHSFQFQFHWFLVAHNYPQAECLRVRILNTRFNAWSWSCEFRRSDLTAIESRVRQAVSDFLTYHDLSYDVSVDENTGKRRKLPLSLARPTLEKCSQCDTTLECPAAASPLRDVKANPSKALDDLIALEAKVKDLRKLLAAHGDSLDTDVSSSDGKVCFGRREPRAAPKKKPSPKMYKVAISENDGEEESDE